MLPRGRGYIAAYELAFPFVAYAATDDIMLAGGTPLFGGLDERIVYFAPRSASTRMESPMLRSEGCSSRS